MIPEVATSEMAHITAFLRPLDDRNVLWLFDGDAKLSRTAPLHVAKCTEDVSSTPS